MSARARPPETTGTAYAAWAPHASIAQPPTADPAEMPMRMPVIATAMPSVTRAAGTRRCASDRLVMSIGAVAEPATNMTTASGHSPPTSRAGTSSTNIAVAASISRRVIVERKTRLPNTMPASVEPEREAAEDDAREAGLARAPWRRRRR